MFIPFLSTKASRVSKRKGGGGGGRGGAGKGGGSSGRPGGRPPTGRPSTGTGGGNTPGSGTGSNRPGSVSAPSPPPPRPAFSLPPAPGTPSGALKTSTYGQGGGLITTVPAGQPFAGRRLGGGTRDSVFGSRTFGSGTGGRGVRGAGLPYYFWPLAWGAGLGYGAGYLHDNEFGTPTNSTRPGGALVQVAIVAPPPTSSAYHVIADNSTAAALIGTITESCGADIANKPLRSKPFTGSPDDPRPESAIQYYRASSVVLTLDGYNNTAALGDDAKLPDTPLPTGINTTFMDCLNRTIGASVPLVDAVQAASDGGSNGSNPGGVSLNGVQALSAPLWLLVATLGGGLITTVPKGLPFAGRTLGGGTRGGVYGSRTFGSALDGRFGARGVRGAGLPYYFWPLAWGAGLGYGAGYLNDGEFGAPDNSTRPGGALAQVAIQSPPPISTYHVVADNSTVTALIDTITNACGNNVTNKPLHSAPFTGSPDDPRPESAIQHYRASSVVLTLDGYNTAALSYDATSRTRPFPRESTHRSSIV
ncbi:hypothetical protein AURDEDRAFT_184133 [Auricularia subglabra TFB-10046 SS5]|nr:hypothetical protein AURDEDRAFT_184133 [Auricularia subglabra TFB-10046 SS5]